MTVDFAIPPINTPWLDPASIRNNDARAATIHPLWYSVISGLIRRTGGRPGLGDIDQSASISYGEIEEVRSSINVGDQFLASEVAASVEDIRSQLTSALFQVQSMEQSIEDLLSRVSSISDNGDLRGLLGSMASQNYDRVSVTGGAINGTPMGGTTPAAATFTTASVITDNGVVLTNQTSDAGAQTATLTNGPTAGNPTFWARVKINGSNFAVPAWPAV